MANLSLTLDCNRSCSYCFARAMGPAAGFAPMPGPTFRTVMALLKRSGIPEVRLLGGEPTLHPDFLDLVAFALEEGLRVRVFTNGLMAERMALTLAANAPEQVFMLVNVNTPARSTAPELETLERTLAVLGPRAQLGHNFVDPAADLAFLLDLIESYDLRRAVRIGLAHPCVGVQNEYLHPKRYAWAGARIAAFAADAARRDVRLEPDCGFVPCMFPEGFLENGHGFDRQVGLQCGAVPDILPDATAVPCYPLARVWRLPLGENDAAETVIASLSRAMSSFRQAGIFRECGTCERRACGDCRGGCLAAAMLRLRGPAPHASLAALGPALLPVVDRPD